MSRLSILLRYMADREVQLGAGPIRQLGCSAWVPVGRTRLDTQAFEHTLEEPNAASSVASNGSNRRRPEDARVILIGTLTREKHSPA